MGQRGRTLLAALAEHPGKFVPLHELAEPDVRNVSCDMTNARQTVRALEQRGLVVSMSKPDPRKLVPMSVVRGGPHSAWGEDYRQVVLGRIWHGTWVRITWQGLAMLQTWRA